MRSILKLLLCTSIVKIGAEPNPPNWDGRRVKIIDPNNAGGAQKIVDDIFHEVGGDGFHG